MLANSHLFEFSVSASVLPVRISARAKKAAALLLGTAEPLFLIQLAFGPLSRPSARACTAAERPAELQVPIRS